MLRVMGDMVKALWHLNDHLVNIKEELVKTKKAIKKESQLLHHLLVNNLRQIDMPLKGRRT